MGSPFNIQSVGDPFNEAVTVAELKKHLRVSHTADDSYIGLLSIAARQMVEKDFNRKIVGQEYNLFLPYGWYNYQAWLGNGYSSLMLWSYIAFGVSYLAYPKIEMPLTPTAAIKSIAYTDETNTPQTLANTKYTFKSYMEPSAILLTSTPLPAILLPSDIVINLVAGEGVYTPATETDPEVWTPKIDQLFKNAIYLLVGAWYENREPVSESLVRAVPLSYERIKELLSIKRFR